MMRYEKSATEAALDTYRVRPGDLTDLDLERLRLVDPALADHGRLARTRAHAVPPDGVRQPASPQAPAPTAVFGLSATQFADVVGGGIRAMIAPLAARIRQLETERTGLVQRVVELEQRPAGVKYAGVWHTGQRYTVDAAVTHRGSLWIARANHLESEPGADPVGWQLCCKRGRDGKDQR
jgi:hypothetical protein